MHESDEKVGMAHLISDLNDLVHMHYDVVANYRAVVPKAESPWVKAATEKFANEHSLQIANLSRLIRRYDGDPAGGTDYRQLEGKIRVAAGQLFRDPGLLGAMRRLEHKLTLEYERCLLSLRAVPDLEPLLDEHFKAGQQRLHEIEKLIESLDKPEQDKTRQYSD